MGCIKEFPLSCNKDCGGGCALTGKVDIEEDRLLGVKNSIHAPEYMSGCVTGLNAEKILYAPDRILHPLIRTGIRGSGQFREASWDEAISLAAEKIRTIKESYGSDSIMLFSGSGACKSVLHNTSILPKRFFRLYSPCVEMLLSYSSPAATFITPYVYGTLQCGFDMETLFESKLIILWGHNAAETRYSSKITSILAKIKKAGNIPIIAIDPRRTSTVKALSTEWISIYPGTDSILMCAILHELITNNLTDTSFISDGVAGFNLLSDYILGKTDFQPKTPEWAEKLCGIEAKKISQLALLFGRTKPCAILPGLSIQRTLGGEDTFRLCMALQAAAGNVGKTGGSSGTSFWGKLPSPLFLSLSFPDNINPSSIPIYSWPDRILNNPPYEKMPPIKLLYNPGSNFLSQGADINKNISAFNKLDFVITHDVFMTPTARFSDIIFPVTMWMEREDVIPGVGNCLLYSAKAVAPPESVKDDYDIYQLLSRELGFEESFSEGRSSTQWLEYLMSSSAIADRDDFIRKGIFTGNEKPRTAFADFVSNPGKYPLKTPSGLIEISSDTYHRNTGFSPFPKAVNFAASEQYSLRLITPHYRKRINSSHSNIPFFSGNEEDYLWMNPEDAETRSINNSDTVLIFNETGSLQTKVFVTEDIKQGVISLNQGIWPEFQGSKVIKENSANFLASTKPTLPSGGARTHSIFAEVKPI